LILFSMSLIGLSVPASAGNSPAVSGGVVEQNCSSWSPDSNSISIGTKLKQERTCTSGYESRYTSGKKQAWANQTAINNDWAATGAKYNCKTIAGNQVCDVKQEKSSMIVQKDSVSGMLRIESISKTSRVSSVTDSVAFVAPIYTVPPASADKVASTYEQCGTSVSDWIPAANTVSDLTKFTQVQTTTVSCTTYQSWTSGKIVAISSSSTPTTKSQTVKGELCVPFVVSSSGYYYNHVCPGQGTAVYVDY
jgi:hypothetical protein